VQHSRCAGGWWWWASQHNALLLASRRTDLLGTAHVRERHVRPDWVVVVNPRCMSCQALAHASLTSGGACSIVSIPACWACRSDRNLGRQQERAITLTMAMVASLSGPMLYTFPRLDVTCSVSSVLGVTLARAWLGAGRELLDWPSTKRPRCASFYLHRSPSSATAATRVLSALLRDPWLGGDVGNQNPVHPATNRRAFKWMQLDVLRLTSHRTCFCHRTAGQHVLPCGCRLSGAS
jgi:hypothetical protein